MRSDLLATQNEAIQKTHTLHRKDTLGNSLMSPDSPDAKSNYKSQLNFQISLASM